MIVEEPQPVTVVVPGAGFATAVVDPPTVPDMPVSPWAASWVPACCTVCSTCARAAAGMLAPPIDAPFAVWPSKSEPQVTSPTIPSTSSPFACW
jgi:hypothetical protein